jgi:hypothetical protein
MPINNSNHINKKIDPSYKDYYVNLQKYIEREKMNKEEVITSNNHYLRNLSKPFQHF